jgi:CheY-like chemotaxis protein
MNHVVYLDDEKDLTNIFKQLFESTYHDIKVFNKEQDALEYCLNTPPDILFVDYRLENMTGDQVAAALPDTVSTVLVTGDIRVESSFKFDAVIKKPFKLIELLSTVEELGK